MFLSAIADDQLESEDPDDEKNAVSSALTFYKKALSYYPN
jgi:hypothetical protein